VAGEAQRHDTENELGAELLRLHRESYGEGASSSRVYIHDDIVFCLLDEIELLQVEQFMVERGEAEAVLEIRGRYQAAIEGTFRAAVERATGRRVISFASVSKLDPHYVLEIFRLGDPADQQMPADPEEES
jgi:uncharacterized protein YbcI